MRNSTIDGLKTLSALAVVFIHCNKVQGDIGQMYTLAIRSLSRVAVPFFFMITGFYLSSLIEKRKCTQYVGKILKLAIISSVFYLFEAPIVALFRDEITGFFFWGGMFSWLESRYSIKLFIECLLTCKDPFKYHLWYLYALVYSLLFLTVVLKSSYRDYIRYILLIIPLIITYEYLGLEYPLTRNYLLGIPCIVIGFLTYESRNIFPIQYLWMGIIITSLLSIVESLVLWQYRLLDLDVYSCTIPLAWLLLLFAKQRPYCIDNGLSKIGLLYSTGIYIFHPFVADMLKFFFSRDTTMNQFIFPYLVFALTILFCMCLRLIERKLYTFKHKVQH